MKRFGCTESLLMLPISGAFLALLGLVLIILYIVARGLTASLYYIEGAVPTYVAAVLLILTGAAMFILLKKRPNLLIYLAIALNCVAFSVCTLQAISVGIVSIPFLGSFSACVYHNSLSECQCYILSARENNSTGIIVPGADSEKVTFQAVRSCAVIEHNMIDCLYILCIIYGFAGIASLVTGSLSFMLLCSQRRASKEAHALQVAAFPRHRRTLSDTGRAQSNGTDRESRNPPNTEPSSPVSASTTAGNNTAPGRRATIGHHDVRNDRPRIVQRSSSTSGTHGRQQARHNSVGGQVRGPAAAQHPSQSQRQGRPPALIRGGYLQIHVNGPSIPVYIVPGSSNEAFIALTDLPSLQLPSLDTVPAYVSEVTDLYPNDQPPPYSPTPDDHQPPAFSVIMESPPTPISGMRRDQPQRPVLQEDDSINQSRAEQVQSEHLSPGESHQHAEVAEVSTGSAVASSSSLLMNNAEPTGSDQTGVDQTGPAFEGQGQTDQSRMCQPSPGESRQQLLPSDSGQQADCIPLNGSDIQQSHDNALEVSRISNERNNSANVSPRSDESEIQAEPSTAHVTQPEISPPRNSQTDPTRDRPALESEERFPVTSQGTRPKHRQSRPHTGEEDYIVHARSSSPPRKSSPHRGPSPQRRSSPSRKSNSPNRRQYTSIAEVSENPIRQSGRETPSNREIARARSNSRGRQRQLPDILPRIDHLPDTGMRSSSNLARQQLAENASNRAKPHQKKPHQQHSSQKRGDPSPQLSSRREADPKRPPKNPQNIQSQSVTRSRSREKPSQHNPDSKKDSARKDHKHHSNANKRKSGSAKIEMNIPPNPNSSSTESLTNIMTLVESVHSSVKIKPKKRQTSNLEKVNLVDSKV